MRPIRALMILAAALIAFAGAPALAQTVTSAGPDKVSVTIYRDPGRGVDGAFELSWLGGYALITERRTVHIPAGRTVIRFEGVAGGILPESAIVTGLPDGVLEKNLDADLLSPSSLYARSYGRPVTIRHRRFGQVVEEPAIIRSGPEGAAIFETKDGFITADCDFGSDSIIYESLPAGLSARPTLSIETQSATARDVTITLSYLAWGFDWQANYVATMRPDGKTAELFAWVTLANGDVTSFADAETMVVGGTVNRESGGGLADRLVSGGEALEFQCVSPRENVMPPPMVMPAPAMMESGDEDAIVVTGVRASLGNAMNVKRVTTEELGDLKLFRIPEPTTVAANSQKQVALLVRERVPVDIVYRSNFYADQAGGIMLVLRAQNRENRGLGLALPAGKVAVFEPQGDANLLIGEGSITDKAVGEEVEVELSPATQVSVSAAKVREAKGWTHYSATVRNANPFPIRFEATLNMDNGTYRFEGRPKRGRKNGYDLWIVEVPANGTATLRYSFRSNPR